MSAQRIVVTSPWKLGLFVFLLVAACGFGLIYAYYGYFGGRLDFNDPESLRNFYAVCGAVAFLGLLGYLAIVSAAQPANLVANQGRQRRNLMKKAAKIQDPNQVDLDQFKGEPALVTLLERWREDRLYAEAARAQGLKLEATEGAAEDSAPAPASGATPAPASGATPTDAGQAAPAATPQTANPRPVDPASAEGQLAAIHDELFQRNAAPAAAAAAQAPPAAQERVYDLSAFGAVELPSAQEAAQGERIYDLNEFGAVEL